MRRTTAILMVAIFLASCSSRTEKNDINHAEKIEIPESIVNEVKALGGYVGERPWQTGIFIDNLYCGMPLRFFPTKHDGNGDDYGIYYPRHQSKGWFALFIMDEARICVVTTSLDNFIKNKAKYFNENIPIPDSEGFPWEISIERFTKKIGFTEDIGSIPLHFLADNFDWGIWNRQKESYIIKGEQVRKWFLETCKSKYGLNNYFLYPQALMQWRPWVALGNEYAKNGEIASAMNCFDMAIQMSHRYPFYGETTESDPEWSRLRDILALIKPVIDKSDAIDKLTYSIIYKSAVGFSKKDK